MASNLLPPKDAGLKRKGTVSVPEETSSQPKLPPEIIEEILTKLPAESLSKFRCVCKSWKSLIADPLFVVKHLGKSIASNTVTHHRIFINQNSQEMILRSYSVDSIFAERSCHIGESVRFPLKREIRIFGFVGSCNGLVCFLVGDGLRDEIYICNPCTRESRKFPSVFSTSVARNIYGFGNGVQNADDYKLVRMDKLFPMPGKIKVDIFSLATGSAKNIQDFPYEGRINDDGSPNGIFLNGSLHWTACQAQGKAIIALDLTTETYREMPLPEFVEENPRCMLKLDAFCGRLLLLCNYRRRQTDVWTMKEYGRKQSWTKMVKVPCTEVSSPLFRFPKLISISEDGENILMTRQLSLVMYNIKEDAFYTVPSPDFSDLNDNGYQLRARLEFNTVASVVSPSLIMPRCSGFA